MMLDVVCQSGQFIWKRTKAKLVSKDLNQMTIQKTQFTLLESKHAHLFPAVNDETSINLKAVMIQQIMHDHGALFFRELKEVSGLMPVELEQVLIHLIKQGLITADGYQALRVFSMSPADRRRQLQKAKKHANNLGYLEMMGRWSLLPQKEVKPSEYIQLMLNRYGILSYDIWNTEDMPVKWRKVSFELQRMEARGEILAGRFIQNMEGMQYALPDVYQKIQSLQPVVG